MKRKIVVENSLENIRDYLARKGYDVRTMYKNDTLDNITSNEYEAIVVSDLNNGNFPSHFNTSAPIVEAAGLTPEQVYEKISKGMK